MATGQVATLAVKIGQFSTHSWREEVMALKQQPSPCSFVSNRNVENCYCPWN